jgi:membrane protein insertase Oxa1/YidC/SpoIIIJ
MTDFNLDDDVASPLARFCKLARWYIILVNTLVMCMVGTSFTILMWREDHAIASVGGWVFVPAVLGIAAFLVMRLAYRAEEGTKEQKPIKTLLRTVLSVGVIVLIFFYGILLTT